MDSPDQLTPGELMPTGSCRLCPHQERWTHETAVVHAMVWHVYELHRQRWNFLVGNRPPVNPRPETVPGALRLL